MIWQAMREAGLSVEDVQVRDVYAMVDDERRRTSTASRPRSSRRG
jgi:hypothetical protein